MTECPQHIKNHDGTIRAVRCRRWDCPTCGPIHAAEIIAASRILDFNQLIGARVTADDFPKVWKRIRARIPGLSYIAVIHRKPSPHVHLALTGCTAADFERHAIAAGAADVHALPCRQPVDYIGYITRQRMDSSDTRISHSRDITWALRRAKELQHDPVRLGCEFADRRTAAAAVPDPGPAEVPPQPNDGTSIAAARDPRAPLTTNDGTGRAATSSCETNDVHPGTAGDRCSARPEMSSMAISADGRQSTIGLLLSLLAGHTGSITITLQLEVPDHAVPPSQPVAGSEPASGTTAAPFPGPRSVAAEETRRAEAHRPAAGPQAVAAEEAAVQETDDQETVEEEMNED